MQPNAALSPLDHDATITFVGHATTLVEMSGTRILTDPVFRHRFRLLRRSSELTTGTIDLHNLDAVVLSHMHFDHMDYPSLRMIPEGTPIVAPVGAAKYLRKQVKHDVMEMNIGETLEIGGIVIHAVPSHHRSGFYWPMWHPKSVLSYMFVGTQTVYFIGDTALFDTMRDIGRTYDIDAAMVPVWGCGPYLRGDHMTPAQAAEALSMLSPRVAVPIHWGTLHPMGPWWKKMNFLHRPPHAFALEATRSAPETDVRVLRPGDSTVIRSERAEAFESARPGLEGLRLEPALI